MTIITNQEQPKVLLMVITLNMKAKRTKAKIYHLMNILTIFRPYLSHIINDHKTLKNLRVHSSNEVIDYKTQYGEWGIKLTMLINFISFKDSEESCNM